MSTPPAPHRDHYSLGADAPMIYAMDPFLAASRHLEAQLERDRVARVAPAVRGRHVRRSPRMLLGSAFAVLLAWLRLL